MSKLYLVSLLLLSGCGITQYQKMWDIHDSLHTSEIEQAIKEAQEYGIERR